MPLGGMSDRLSAKPEASDLQPELPLRPDSSRRARPRRIR
jgi:hypothetical protein